MKMSEILKGDNLSDGLSDKERSRIGGLVVDRYLEDESSRSGWLKSCTDWQDLAMQIAQKKTAPWGNSANVLYPLISIASTQFAARTYPALISGSDIVKVKVPDPSLQGQGDAMATDLSTLLMDEMPEFEVDMDRMLHVISVPGICFKKTFWDKDNGRPYSGMVLAKDLVTNYYTKTLEDDTAITHVIRYSDNEIESFMRKGIWSRIELNRGFDNDVGRRGLSVPVHQQRVFLEQHMVFDLDGDGYSEPYIATVEKDSGRLVSLRRRFLGEESIERRNKVIVDIRAEHFFTKYPYIPAADGGFYDSGLGQLLGPINNSVNTLINQMIDAGTLQNLGGGWISRGIKMKGGSMRFSPGEYKFVDSRGEDLRRGIFPLPTPGPSQELFSLLSLLIDSGQKLSSMTDPVTGKSPGTHVPATTTLALIEQGMKVFSGITKRMHRAFKEELRKIYRLQRIYSADPLYEINEFELLPYSDPTAINPAQHLAKAEALMQFIQDPDFNGLEIKRRYLEAIGTPDIEKVLAPEPQGPDMAAQIEMAKQKREDMKVHIKLKELEVQKLEVEARVLELRSKALKNMGEMEMDTTDEAHAGAMQGYALIKGELDDRERRIAEMESGSDNGGAVQTPGDSTGGADNPPIQPGS